MKKYAQKIMTQIEHDPTGLKDVGITMPTFIPPLKK